MPSSERLSPVYSFSQIYLNLVINVMIGAGSDCVVHKSNFMYRYVGRKKPRRYRAPTR